MLANRLSGLIERRDLTESAWLLRALGLGSNTYTGKNIGVTDAMHLSTVHRCVTLLTETIATLPLIVYRRSDTGRDRAGDHYMYRLLHDAPNPEMTAVEFWEALIGHQELWGNAYAEIQRSNAGRVVALWPLRPDRMQVYRDANRHPVYDYTLPSGEIVRMPASSMFHLRSFSYDGLVGLSRISLARESIGLSLGLEEYGARYFGNNASPSGVLQHPKSMSDSAGKRLRENWEEQHRGLSNAHRVAILEEGMTWQSISVPARDSEFIASRNFQKEEIADWFGIPHHKVGIMTSATFSNIEHQAIEFVTDAVRPRCVRIEQRIKQDLFTEQAQSNYFAEFLVDGLLRGDAKSRADALFVMRQGGAITGNEWRELSNMNPLPGGDDLWRPVNMVPADTPVAPVAVNPAAAPAA